MLNNTLAPTDSIINSIPFLIFTYVADAKRQITAREADAFAVLLEDTAWCKSALVKQAMQATAEQYASLWKSYAAAATATDAGDIRAAVDALQAQIDPNAWPLLCQDFEHVAKTVARASGGMLGGLSLNREKIAAGDFVVNLLNRPVRGQDAQSGAGEPPGQLPIAVPLPSAVVTGIDAKQLWPLAGLNAENLPVWGKGKTQVRCVRIIDETHDVKTFKFAAVAPMLFLYKPGQFATLELPIDDKLVRRSYTISSTPSRPHTMSVTVKRVPGGVVSNWLHDNLKEGDEINLNGPNGKFNLFDIPSRKLLLISGGSGITPVMSMLRWLMDTNAECDVVFATSARTPKDVIFQRELELLDSQFSHLKVAVSCSASELGRTWMGYTGHLNQRMIEMIAPDYAERTAYICGPTFFMDAMKKALLEMGLPAERYFQESFGEPPKTQSSANAAKPAVAGTLATVPVASPKPVAPLVAVAPSPVAPPPAKVLPSVQPAEFKPSGSNTLVFSLSGQEIVHSGEDGILEAAEAHGIELASSCRAGACGTCKVKKTDGVVHMETTDGLTEDELREGYILTCIGRPEGRVVLEA